MEIDIVPEWIQIYDKENFSECYYAFTIISDVFSFNEKKEENENVTGFVERMKRRIMEEKVEDFTETVIFEELHEYPDYTSEKDPE